MEAIVEGVERLTPLRRVERHENAEGALAIGHIVGSVELRFREIRSSRLVRRRNEAKRNGAEAPDAFCLG